MLYIVATPIGNLDEISFRAIDVLKKVSLIAAEDTRHSAMLLKRFEIKTPMISYQKFSEKKSSAFLIEKLKAGQDIALISDAGTPLISDPGFTIVSDCVQNDIPYTVVSGPCAAVSAVVLSGLDCGRFCMLGFLPDKISERKKLVEPFVFVPSSLVFYTPPQSVLKDLEFLAGLLGRRAFALVKEISKLHETVYRGFLDEFNSLEINLKGEFVLVVEGYTGLSEEKSVIELVEEYLGIGLDKMDAIKRAARDKNLSKSEVYRQVNGGMDKDDRL